MTGRPLTLITTTLCLATGVVLGVMLQQEFPLAVRTADSTNLLGRTLDYVDSHYVDEIPETKLVNGALEGLFSNLDDHSRFLDVDAMREIESEARGHYGGIGLEVSLVEEYFTVIRTIANSPAARAGIAAGDRVTEVGDQTLRGKRLDDLIQMLRGKSGTEVTLVVERDGATLRHQLRRERIDYTSVEFSEPAPGIAYLRISLFSDTTAKKVGEYLDRISREVPARTGLVLDLRNNPGGLLQAAVDVADLFLDKGLIVRTEGRAADSKMAYFATPGDNTVTLPVVILVDGATASAAEVVTGALQHAGRAQVMGSTTYGKGSVQTLFGIEGARGIKLTTARYYTATGLTIDGRGISPDVPWTGDADDLLGYAVQSLQSAAAPLGGDIAGSGPRDQAQ